MNDLGLSKILQSTGCWTTLAAKEREGSMKEKKAGDFGDLCGTGDCEEGVLTSYGNHVFKA